VRIVRAAATALEFEVGPRGALVMGLGVRPKGRFCKCVA
jgi:hypothetical protein